MAAPAELSAERLRALPGSWSYGISQGGRVFFINEEAKSTTWLHPLTGEAVITGHRRSADLPTGWEEAYTFEGARYYVNHNERKVTCKHPVTGQPSQDNCIFVVNEQTAAAMTSEEKKERPVSMICEATNYNLTSDYAAHPMSPVGRTSRSSKKVHNFGKRSNSIKRNPNAPVVRRGWLYKQDSTGMKLWKKRWFVLSDLCLFYYRDEKEEGILGSILLPSFQISVLSAEDHINRKYAFKAAHPNMRTYYFCTDTGKEMELWMKAMTDAALVQTEPVKRVEKLTTENTPPREANNISNHRVLIKPDAQNNQKNKEVNKNEEKKALEAEKYGFQKVGQDKPLTKINSVKLNPLGSEYRTLPISMIPAGHFRPVHLNGSENKALGVVLAEAGDGGQHNVVQAHMESERVMQRTNSMLQLEQWIKIQRGKGQEEETRGIISYQTLPRNMPSHRPQVLPRYPEGYRTLPRNSKARPESLCSVTPSGYDRAVGPVIAEEKRRSMRDDTMWQLYEWQQRQFYNKQTTLTRHSTLSSPKTMINISDQTMHSIPTSPSHGSIAGFQGYSPQRTYRSEVSSPVQRGDITIDRRHRTHHTKHVFVPDRRSMPAGLSLQPVTPQSLQGKTPEELTLLLIKLRRQQAELSSIREHTLAQLMQLKLEASSPKNEILSHHLQRNAIYLDHQLTQEECRGTLYKYRTEELDIDAKLSHLCEQDKVVQALEEKLQQLHKEKYTLEQALLSASQEIEMNADNPAAIQSVVLQRDDLQNGLLSTCREVSRATAELERAWREYDKLEYDVTVTRNHMQEQLDRLGEIQTESAGIQRAQIQKELWRIQDVMEGLSKHKQQRSSSEAGIMGSRTFSTIKYKNEGPDYRLYKSEPELTTVAEVDESNGEEKTEQISESESAAKGSHFPVGVVPPRTKSPTPESSTIASYVTLRKNKKIDLRTERPRSAVEQLCLAESTRPRMTVEEQMERIKRHQQACLREKRKGLNIIGVSDQSPSQSLSFVRDNPFKLAQNRKKDDTVSSNMKELERTSKENNLKQNNGSPGEEIAQLKHDGEQEHNSGFTKELTKTGDLLSDTHVVSDSKEVSNEEKAEKEKKNKLEETHDGDISLQSVTTVTNHKPKTSSEESEVVSIQEQEGIMSSFELAAQSSKGNQATAVKSLPSSPESSLSPAPSTQTQLTEGSHFITNGFY
ncbi:pleckstrin homology domain-containing family A member 5 isoform X9 [Falco biarmicus]|uniref:pleckstrin homology domain-containing family A member 5 isoform X8 n=1 Tax=Falco rusticolus TaxID=120794 RepID=UPI0018867E15|nr:pleckstrin homology domain-containing family A member 5 isoform X8 [Falco rusticolus]XP_055567654.1 pleckstrin homology domain-containing family A member 5 isoform X9 [Falco cherrug]XP_055664080.1 pleckstrin homology domain-containing family A member 5 isoform X9 [Falco peregrinus]XP_056196499.1 pleckstrin homology domain-containing family A member 5 isoform X9 [Falco biarmicus]